jgi:hypothetical protein
LLYYINVLVKEKVRNMRLIKKENVSYALGHLGDTAARAVAAAVVIGASYPLITRAVEKIANHDSGLRVYDIGQQIINAQARAMFYPVQTEETYESLRKRIADGMKKDCLEHDGVAIGV